MQRYLIIQLARFGDLIQTKRLISTLCARPESEVHLCLDTSLAALAKLVYPGVHLYPIAAHNTGMTREQAAATILTANRQTFAELRATNFETIYNLNFSPLNFRVASLFPPEIMRGYRWRNGQEIRDIWPSMAMRWSASRRVGINLVDFWAGYCPDMIPGQEVNPAATPKGGGIGVVLAGRESRRSLPPELLARYATAMVRKEKSPRLVLLGSASEQRAGQAMLKQLPTEVAEKTENLAGRTDWPGLAEVVGSLDALLTPDTGTMHLAAHLGTPVRAFFLSSAWCYETGPYGAGHIIYQALTDCTPCLESAECHEAVRCRRPFEDPGFERFLLTDKPEHRPEGLLSLVPEFDELGISYTDTGGQNSDAEMRTQVRAFLANFLLHKGRTSGEYNRILAEKWYLERDFIVEHNIETSRHTL